MVNHEEGFLTGLDSLISVSIVEQYIVSLPGMWRVQWLSNQFDESRVTLGSSSAIGLHPGCLVPRLRMFAVQWSSHRVQHSHCVLLLQIMEEVDLKC
jgi:hypothetical protein